MIHNLQLRQKQNYTTLVIHSTDNTFGFGIRKNNAANFLIKSESKKNINIIRGMNKTLRIVNKFATLKIISSLNMCECYLQY